MSGFSNRPGKKSGSIGDNGKENGGYYVRVMSLRIMDNKKQTTIQWGIAAVHVWTMQTSSFVMPIGTFLGSTMI